MKLAEAQAIVGSAIAASREPPVRLWFTQCPHVSEAEALALVQRLTGRVSADLWTWAVTREMLAEWPATARAALISRVAALRKGRRRTETLCLLAEHLDAALLRQGFDGLLAGHSPEQEVHSGMVCSNSGLHEALLRRVPLAWKDEWCARLRGKGDSLVDPEIFARSRIDGWTEARCSAAMPSSGRARSPRRSCRGTYTGSPRCCLRRYAPRRSHACVPAPTMTSGGMSSSASST